MRAAAFVAFVSTPAYAGSIIPYSVIGGKTVCAKPSGDAVLQEACSGSTESRVEVTWNQESSGKCAYAAGAKGSLTSPNFKDGDELKISGDDTKCFQTYVPADGGQEPSPYYGWFMVSSPNGEIRGCIAQDENQTPGTPFKVLNWCSDKPCDGDRPDKYKCTKTWLVKDASKPPAPVHFKHSFIAYSRIPIKGDALDTQYRTVCMQAQKTSSGGIHVVTKTNCDEDIVAQDPEHDLIWHQREGKGCMYAEDDAHSITSPNEKNEDIVTAKPDDSRCFETFPSTDGHGKDEGYFLVSAPDGTLRGCVAQDDGKNGGTSYKILTYCDQNNNMCNSPDNCKPCKDYSGLGYTCWPTWKVKDVSQPHMATPSSLIV